MVPCTPWNGGSRAAERTAVSGKKLLILKDFYRTAIKAIKAIDKNHAIFVEGNTWAQDIEFLKDILEDNIVISIHAYQPLEYTFQFVRSQRYPGLICGERWDRKKICRYLDRYYAFSKKHSVEIFVGEFGINYRGNCYGEVDYLSDLLSTFDQYGFDWTYWTYKAVANNVFPDGVYQYRDNPAWICREGPVSGWENYYQLWERNKRAIVQSWKTEQYTLNKDIAKALKQYFQRG